MQAGVDAVDDLGDGLTAGCQRLEHLLFTLGAMLQVLVDQRRTSSITGPWPGRQAGWREIADAAQRRQVLREIAAFAGRDDDGAAAPGEVAAIEIARRLVEEAEVVGRVAGRVQRQQLRVAGGDDLAVRQRSGGKLRTAAGASARAAPEYRRRDPDGRA